MRKLRLWIYAVRVTQTFQCLSPDRTGSGSLTACAYPQLHPTAYTDISESGSRTRVWNFKNISLYIFLPLSSCSSGEQGKEVKEKGLAIVSQTVESRVTTEVASDVKTSVDEWLPVQELLVQPEKKKKKENFFLKIYIWMQVLFCRTKLQGGWPCYACSKDDRHLMMIKT